MGVRLSRNFASLERDAMRAMRKAVEEMARDVHTGEVDGTPVESGRLQKGWRWRVQGLTGTVGNSVPYADEVAEGPKGRRPTPKERQNIGFHKRAADNRMRRVGIIFHAVFKKVFG